MFRKLNSGSEQTRQTAFLHWIKKSLRQLYSLIALLWVMCVWVQPGSFLSVWVTGRSVETSTHTRHVGGSDAHEWYLLLPLPPLIGARTQRWCNKLPPVHIRMASSQLITQRCITGRPLRCDLTVQPPVTLALNRLSFVLCFLPGVERRETKKCSSIRHFENMFVVETRICDRV